MKKVRKEKKDNPENPKESENLEMEEIKAIRGKLAEMHSDIKKVMEYSNKLRFETALESSRQEYSHSLQNYLFEDIGTGLERNMVKKCPEKGNCTSAFTTILQHNAGLIKYNEVDEAIISDNRKKLDELKCGAPYRKCEQCFSKVLNLFIKQINIMRSMEIYENNQGQKPDISALKTSVAMSEILNPISNKQRLEILKAVAFEPKSFSAFSKLTGLIAGNLLFHLQKLMDCELILQQHDRGDYVITEKGFKILQSLNEIYFSLQYFPQQIYNSNLFEESKKEELTDESKMVELTEALKQMALTRGASKVGIATTKTLLGGPPSADLTYVLPEAKSAVCFALAFDQNLIDPYFRKVDRESLETNKVRTTILADGIALEIANFLQQSGYKAVPQPANFVYRKDTKNWLLDMHPPISHKYLAVRSGIGHFGYSGTIITKEYGSAIVLVSVVTDAELIQTDSLPEEENYCDECKLCLSVCLSGYVDLVEKVTVTLGGKKFSYGKRRNNSRCLLVCRGLTGLNASGSWSTWSPGRFKIPGKDEDFVAAISAAAQAYLGRPKLKGGFFVPIMSGSMMDFPCSNCHLVCHPDKEVRIARYKMLIESGVVIQELDGPRRGVSPEEAKEYLNSMPLE